MRAVNAFRTQANLMKNASEKNIPGKVLDIHEVRLSCLMRYLAYAAMLNNMGEMTNVITQLYPDLSCSIFKINQ
jgi:hypothetical protein